MVRDEPSHSPVPLPPPPSSLAELRRANDDLERRIADLLAEPEAAAVATPVVDAVVVPEHEPASDDEHTSDSSPAEHDDD